MTEAELRAALEDAMLDVFDGSPPGPLLAGRVYRASVEVLRRNGVQGSVEVAEGGQRVRIGLRARDRVRYVVLSFAPY
jgi:hypothetical protein